MKLDGHQAKALRIERAIGKLGDPATTPDDRGLLIESYWGAAFHWTADGCKCKHGSPRRSTKG
jgi:hypothetical protein